MSVSKVLNEWSDTQFDYHGHDCCRFAAAISKAVTGRDPMASFSYEGKLAAFRLIRKHGKLDDVITATLGDPIETADAKDGDLGVVQMDDGQLIAGAVYKDKLIVKSEGAGFTLFPISYVNDVWSVSCLN